TQLGGAVVVRSYGDAESTRCLYAAPDRVCLSGVTATANPAARNAGAGVELSFASASPLDHAAAGFSMVLQLAGDAPIRVALTSTTHPTAELLLGGTTGGDVSRSGWLVLRFDDFARPPWYADGPTSVDGPRLDALRIRAVG